MTPEQSALLARSLQLLMVALFGGTLSAIAFRRYFNWGIILGSFALSISLVWFVMEPVIATNNPALIYMFMFAFGGSVAADLGGFFAALGLKFELDPEETFRGTVTTVGITFGVTIVAAFIGLFSGINFQFLTNWLFIGLFVLIGLGIATMFGAISQRVEWFIGIAASVFWLIYMIFDFNKFINLYNENTWSAATHTAMGIYLDMINFLVRIAPYVLQAMSHKK